MIRTLLRLTLWAILIAALAAGCLAWWLVDADTARPAQQVTLQIPQGSSVTDIGRQLETAGVLRSATAFGLYVRARGDGRSIQAAEYVFTPHMSMLGVVGVLDAGGRPPTVWITIPEGFTAAQIGALLQKHGIGTRDEFMAVVGATSLRFGPAASRGLEGYLFPDTYEVRRDATPRDVAALLTAHFMHELPRDYVSAARKLGRTVPQIVTAASLIEREAKVDPERPVMASVYYNRLHRGMPLQVDATIEYALPTHKTALSFADLKIDSPYNTYLYAGLPPTPIANPGRASLYAAFHPASTGYLYYVYRGNGHHQFSDTLEEQQAAERRFLP
ncbi:MAG TPA: endolytic transglycosylase MltG [Candidatus Eremiobacteraceae bacterium]